MNKFPAITPQMDEIIKQTYLTVTGKGQVKLLAAKLRLPRWKVSRRAVYLGLVTKIRKEPNWSDTELSILHEWSHLTPERIRLKLKAKGYLRSITAIVLKRKRLRIPSNLNGYSARDVAAGFGVDAKMVTRWIEKRYLKASRRGTARTEAQHGDEWWIKEKDIRNFIINNLEIIDFRKLEKHWLVDILVSGGKKSNDRDDV